MVCCGIDLIMKLLIFVLQTSILDLRTNVIATTQPTTQNKTKQVGWCGIIIGKINHHHTTPGPITF